MKKTVISLLFFFSALIGAWFYIEKTFFFEMDVCLESGKSWNYEQWVCEDIQDSETCRASGWAWIDGENTCELGEIIN